MMQIVVAFLGISGVGKSTFLKNTAQLLSFQHLTAGSLIARARDAQIQYDRLRLQDITENQNLLIEGFNMVRDNSASIVVLDGHAIIDGANGIQTVDEDIFRLLGVNAIAHLEAQPEQIYANRQGDGSRVRPYRSADELGAHQNLSLTTSASIAADLVLPLARFRHGEFESFCLFVRDLVSELKQI